MPVGFHSEEHRVLQRLLRRIRRDMDLTQREVAERMGVRQELISRFENGERRVDLVELRQWCHAVGMSMPDFVQHYEETVDGPSEET